jgi:hypothetical protein
MKTIAGMLIFTLLAAPYVDAASNKDKAACAEVKEKIHNIESRMRAGYTRAQGERYNEKLRELKAKRSKLCR